METRTWCALAVLAMLLAGCADDAPGPSLVWEAADPRLEAASVSYALTCPPGFSGEAPRCQTPAAGAVDQRRLTDIVIDPFDPLHVVVALPVNFGRTTASTDEPDSAPDHVRFLHSMDGGETWSAGAAIELRWIPSNEGTYEVDVSAWFSSSGRLHAIVRATESPMGFLGNNDFYHFWSDAPGEPWQGGARLEGIEPSLPLLRAASLPDGRLLVMAHADGHAHRAWISSDDGASWQPPVDLPVPGCDPSQAAVHNGSAWFACRYQNEQDENVLAMVEVALEVLPGATQLNATATVHPSRKIDCDIELWSPWSALVPPARLTFQEERAVLTANSCTALAHVSWSLAQKRWLDPVEVASGHEAFSRYWTTLALEPDALGNIHAVVTWYASYQINTGGVSFSSSRPAVAYLIASPSGAVIHEQRLDSADEGFTGDTTPVVVDPETPDRAALAFGAGRGWLGWSSLDRHSLVAVQPLLPQTDDG